MYPSISGRKRQPLPPQSERFKEVAAAPPAPPPSQISNSSLPLATPSGPRRLSTLEANHSDVVQQPGRGRPPVQRNNFEDTRGQMGNNSQGTHFEINDRFVEGQPYEERGRPRQWERERDKAFPAELPTGPRAMDHDAEPPRFIRRGRSPPRQRAERSPPSHFATSRPHEFDRRDPLGSGGFGHSFGGTDRAYRDQDRQSGSRVGEVCAGLIGFMFSRLTLSISEPRLESSSTLWPRLPFFVYATSPSSTAT
jgi:hypothetical protein